MQKGPYDQRQPALSGWNPLVPVRDRLRSIAHWVRRDSGSDTSSTSAGRSSWSWTIFSGSSRSSIATSICSLYGHDYSISAALVEFLGISASNGRRIPDVTVFGTLQGVACDPNRAQAARLLTGEASEELASLLQYCLDVSRKDPIISSIDRPTILRLLQDVCSASQKLPTQYRIDGVRFDRRDRIGSGGEAAIYRGTHKGDRVAVREIFTHPEVPQETTHSLIRREVIAQWQADDKNVLRLRGIIVEGDMPLIVLPFLGGGNALHAINRCLIRITPV